MRVFKISLIFIYLLSSVLLFFIRAQNIRYLDSLENAYHTLKTEDEKVKFISKFFVFLHNEKVTEKKFKSYFTKYYNISKKENSNKILQTLYHYAGVYYYYLSDYKKALAFLDSAIAIGNKMKNDEQLLANYMTRGAIKFTMCEYHSSLADYFESEKRMKILMPQKLGGLYNNIAMIYTELNELEQSEYYSNLALYHLKGNDEETYIKVLNNFGIIFKKKNELNKADSVFRLGLSIAKKTNHLQEVLDLQYNLATVLEMKNKYQDAIACLRELEKIIVLNKIDNQNWLKVIYVDCAVLYNKLNNKKLAMKFLTKAENIPWMEQTPSEEKFNYNLSLANLYFELNQFEKSAKLYRKIQAQDFDLNLKKETAFMNVQKIKYHYDKQKDSLAFVKQKEIDALKNKQIQSEMEFRINRQKIIIFVSVIILILISLFSLFLFRAIKLKEKANLELSIQKQLLMKKNEEITDSINYAKRIQQSFLPSEQQLKEILKDYFLLYFPKDIVSGDFYWVKKLNQQEFFVAVGDCTGHGVPGAIMSALSVQLLNEVALRNENPDEILEQLNNNIKKILQQEEEGRSKDGLDMALCKVNLNDGKLYYCGANRNLWIFKDNAFLQEIKADKHGIGGHTPFNQRFNMHEVELHKDDLVILTTDGYADQFGGSKMKKIGNKKLKELLSLLKSKKTDEIHTELENFFIHWKHQTEQTDDVCILGFKFNHYAHLS